jgi:hypothetical protein
MAQRLWQRIAQKKLNLIEVVKSPIKICQLEAGTYEGTQDHIVSNI